MNTSMPHGPNAAIQPMKMPIPMRVKQPVPILASLYSFSFILSDMNPIISIMMRIGMIANGPIVATNKIDNPMNSNNIKHIFPPS
jgi:hypothetical protein